MKTLTLTGILSFFISLGVDLAAGAMLAGKIFIIGDFFTLSLSRNAGVAFGMNLPSPWQEIIIVAALTGVTIVAMQSQKNHWSRVAFGLIIGGAVANLVDRSMHGYVTDFLSVGTFPIFNVADACISIGAGMLLMENSRSKKSILSP